MSNVDQAPAAASQRPEGRGALRSLKHRDFKLFFSGQAISATGRWIQKIALSWLIYRLTGSAAMLGLINLAGGAAALPFALLGGALADRISRRSILVAVYAWMLLQALALAALVGSGAVEVWHLFVLEMFLGAARAIEIPTRQAYLLDTVGREDLSSAVGLDKAIGNLTRLVGPSLAGVIVATVGEATAFLLNAVTFAAGALSVAFMRVLARPARRAGRSVAGDLRDSVAFLRTQPTIQALLALVGISAFLAMPYVILLPVFAKDVLAASAAPVSSAICDGLGSLVDCQSPEAVPFGLLMGAVGLGALVGSIFVAGSSGRRRGAWLTLGNLLLPVAVAGFAASRSFALSLVALTVVGFAAILQTALANILLQLLIPDNYRGRLLALYAVVFQGMMQLGGVQAGFVTEWLGAPVALGSAAAASFVFALLLRWLRPEIGRL